MCTMSHLRCSVPHSRALLRIAATAFVLGAIACFGCRPSPTAALRANGLAVTPLDGGSVLISYSDEMEGMGRAKPACDALVPAIEITDRVNLTLRYARLDIKCFDIFKQINHLTELDLGYAKCQKGVLNHVGALRELRSLCVDGLSLTPAICREIASLPYLSNLDCARADIDDDSVASLATSSSIEILHMDGVLNVSPQGVCALRRLSSLHDLNILGVAINNETIAPYRSCHISVYCSVTVRLLRTTALHRFAICQRYGHL